MLSSCLCLWWAGWLGVVYLFDLFWCAVNCLLFAGIVVWVWVFVGMCLFPGCWWFAIALWFGLVIWLLIWSLLCLRLFVGYLC